ncbi:hypothetical protein [Clostridium botulinum]|uniref:hypothetical protein n=1 Tax=Clostridium botulinum TaxID=1491 RepID=UPI0004DA4942|nr:hypothetical protein [Clostridium botulinum]KEH99968.1 hypothetical protein Z952_14705 [Clostridium botulinum C/D str. BKT75002]KEI05690.1 hypothetical protein Z954_14885 [Clostridium botulinum C/D str. BKT2873]MCD3351764.1 hypothetical protein [Clostridium botulinum D/C]MCD3360690.1 hypothetical protein [Clostridium botulinum D/C]MCD3362116.1 hypothetical protein [Clostridium botulinum D/C]
MPLHTIPLCSFSYVGEFYSGATFKYDTTEDILKSSSKMFYKKHRGRLKKYDNNTLSSLTKKVVKNKEVEMNFNNISVYKNIAKQVKQICRNINENYKKSLLSLKESQLELHKVNHLVKSTIDNMFISKNKILNRYDIKNSTISHNKNLQINRKPSINFKVYKQLKIKKKSNYVFINKNLIWVHRLNESYINATLNLYMNKISNYHMNNNVSVFLVQRYKYKGLGIYDLNKYLNYIIPRAIHIKNNTIAIERCNVKLLIKSKEKYIQRKRYPKSRINALQHKMLHKIANRSIYKIIENRHINIININYSAKVNSNKLLINVITRNIEICLRTYIKRFEKISMKYILKNRIVNNLKRYCIPRQLLDYSISSNLIWMYRVTKKPLGIYNKNKALNYITNIDIHVKNSNILVQKCNVKLIIKFKENYIQREVHINPIVNISHIESMHKVAKHSIYKIIENRYVKVINNNNILKINLSRFMIKFITRNIYLQNNVVRLHRHNIKFAFKDVEKYTTKWSVKNITNISHNIVMYKDGTSNVYKDKNKLISKENSIRLDKNGVHKISKYYGLKLLKCKTKDILVHNTKKLTCSISHKIYIYRKMYILNKKSIGIFKTEQYELDKCCRLISKGQLYCFASGNKSIFKDTRSELSKFNTLICNHARYYFINKSINNMCKNSFYEINKITSLMNKYINDILLSSINRRIFKKRLYNLSKNHKRMFKYIKYYGLNKTINIFKNNEYSLSEYNRVIAKSMQNHELNKFIKANIFKENKYALKKNMKVISKCGLDKYLNRVNNGIFKESPLQLAKQDKNTFKYLNNYQLSKYSKEILVSIQDKYLNRANNSGIFKESPLQLTKQDKNIFKYLNNYQLSKYSKEILVPIQDRYLNRANNSGVLKESSLQLIKQDKNIFRYSRNYELSKYMKVIFTHIKDHSLNRVNEIKILKDFKCRLARINKTIWSELQYCSLNRFNNEIYINNKYNCLNRTIGSIFKCSSYELHKYIRNIFKYNIYDLAKSCALMYKHKKYYLNKILNNVYSDIEYDLTKSTTSIANCEQYDLREASITILKNIYDISMLEIIKRWWILESSGPYDKKILPFDYNYSKSPIEVNRQDREYGCLTALDRHPISFMPYLEDLQGIDLDYGFEEINLSIEIMIEMLNIVGMIIKHSESQFTRCSGKEAIEFTMESILNWLNLESTIKDMNIKNSREHYLRCYKWIRWEAEKLWFMADKNDNLDKFRGIKYSNMLFDNLIEYMKYHHFNKVPLWRNLKAMDIERQFNRVATNNDLIKKIDKLKGKRHYEIKTENYKNNKYF